MSSFQSVFHRLKQVEELLIKMDAKLAEINARLERIETTNMDDAKLVEINTRLERIETTNNRHAANATNAGSSNWTNTNHY